MWDELVRDRGGTAIGSLAAAGAAQLAGARFAAVLTRDETVLPAVAALEPAQAVAHLALSDTGPVVTRAADANRFLERLQASQVEPYLLKAGRVGGADPEVSVEIKQEHATAILNAILAGAVE
jgi:ATP-dependent phosphoenolpyruvate carboxykinase